MKNKLIVLIQMDGDIVGGAQKRYLNVINSILKNNDYYAVLNECLYANAIKAGIIKPHKRLLRINLKEKCKPLQQVTNDQPLNKNHKEIRIVKNKIVLFLGAAKYRLRLGMEWLRFSFQMLSILRKFKIKTVYGIWYGGIWIWPLKYLKKFQLIYSYNDSGFSSLDRQWYNGLLSEFYVLNNADVVDFLSQDLVRGISERGIVLPEGKVSVTPNSFINYENFNPSKYKERVIVFLGRISSIKNPLLLAKAVKLIDIEISERSFKVQFYGHGPVSKELKIFVENNNIKSIELCGSTSAPWVVLNKSMIFVSIQQSNNYPSQAVIEAMAAGNSILASDVGETRKLVTENEGVLVQLTKESIAEGILSLINNIEETEQKGKNAREKVLKEQSLEKFMEYFIEITK